MKTKDLFTIKVLIARDFGGVAKHYLITINIA